MTLTGQSIKKARAKVTKRLVEAREAGKQLDAAWAVHNAAQMALYLAQCELKQLESRT